MSELTGNGKISEEDNISKLIIFTSISPVFNLLFIVSSDLFTTLPLMDNTDSLEIELIWMYINL